MNKIFTDSTSLTNWHDVHSNQFCHHKYSNGQHLIDNGCCDFQRVLQPEIGKMGTLERKWGPFGDPRGSSALGLFFQCVLQNVSKLLKGQDCSLNVFGESYSLPVFSKCLALSFSFQLYLSLSSSLSDILKAQSAAMQCKQIAK